MKKLPVPKITKEEDQDGVTISIDGQPLSPDEIIELLKSGHKYRQLSIDNSNMLNDVLVGEQSAWIEWQHGEGAEAGMRWIANGLWGPGLIPDENEPWSKDSQLWYAANKHNPFPVCICGKPSSILSQGIGACCSEHLEQARAVGHADNEIKKGGDDEQKN